MSTAPATDAALPRIELLGSPKLIDGSGRPHALSANDAALLALVASGRCRSRARLAALLWPDAKESAARNSLRQRLFRMNERVGTAVVAIDDDGTLSVCLPHDLLAPEVRWETDPTALGGELLGDLVFPDREELEALVAGCRLDWRRRRALCLDRIAAAHEGAERLDEALTVRERRVLEEPDDEGARMALAHLLCRRGEYAGAVPLLSKSPGDAAADVPLRQAAKAARDAEAARPPPVPPPLLLRPPRAVGRERERRAAATALGEGRALLLSGAPGMGKSRLLSEFVAADRLLVKSRPGDAGRPFALLERIALSIPATAALPDEHRAWLARAAPSLGVPMAGADAPALMARALVSALRANGTRSMLLDDLHYADTSTLQLLPLLSAADDAPGLLLSVRRAEWPPALTDWQRSDDGELEVVELQPLSAADIDLLLDELGGPSRGAVSGLQHPGLAAALHQHSGGNPLFLLETLRALWDGEAVRYPGPGELPLPRRVGELLERRLAALSAPALQLAQLAALADDALDAELAGVVLGTHPLALAGAWRELERAEILQGSRFVHDLVREACLGTVPAPVQRALHARIAARLQEAPNGVSADRIAHHWEAAEAWHEAGDAWAVAGAENRRRRQREAELRAWRRAAAAHERAGRPDAELAARAEALEVLLTVEGASAALEEVERLQARAPEGRTAVLTGLARLHAFGLTGRFAALAEAAPAVVAAASALPDETLRLRALLLHVQGLGQTGAATAGLARLEAEAPAVRALADDSLDYEFSSALAYLLRLTFRRAEGVEHLKRAVHIAERLHDHHEQMTAHGSVAVHLLDVGRATEGLVHARRASELLGQLGEMRAVTLAAAELNLAATAMASGHLGEALVALLSSLGRLKPEAEAVMWRSLVEVTLAQLYTLCGRYREAAALLADESAPTMPMHRMSRAMLRLRIARLRGQPTAEWVEKLRQAAAGAPARVGPALAALELAQHEPAADAVARLRSAVTELRSMQHLGHALHAQGLLVARLLEAGSEEAAIEARACWATSADVETSEGRLVAWTACARAFVRDGERDRLHDLRRLFEAWRARATAAPLPPSLATTLVERNPHVRELLRLTR